MGKCPMCENGKLHQSFYDDTLPINQCDSCEGAWLRANEYALWLRTQTPGTFGSLRESELVFDSRKAAFCPDCGHFLRRYKIGAKTDFHLDRCNNCNGVWFDRNEWQALKAADLHDEVNRIFTKPWQQRILDEIAARSLEKMYLERFGEHDYEKIKEIRTWLQGNPNRNTILAYLLDDDPYSG